MEGASKEGVRGEKKERVREGGKEGVTVFLLINVNCYDP